MNKTIYLLIAIIGLFYFFNNLKINIDKERKRKQIIEFCLKLEKNKYCEDLKEIK